jgi:hypothetical protein
LGSRGRQAEVQQAIFAAIDSAGVVDTALEVPSRSLLPAVYLSASGN